MRPSHRAVRLFTSVVAMALLPVVAVAQSPSITAVTPELIAAAKKEGQVTFYSSEDLQSVSQIAKSFEAQYPGIKVDVQRSGGERTYQRVMQEYSSNIHNVDFVSSSNRNHLVMWKRAGWLAPFVTEEMNAFPVEQWDPEGTYFSSSGTLCVISYNTKQLKLEDTPKSFADLLDPKWKGKMVKAHPGYSGLILGCTYLVAEKLGWDYLQKLGQQDVMQTQSALDPPRKVVAGERMVGVDGGENSVFALQEAGEPIGLVYPAEGTPGAAAAAGIMKDAPHPNAARLFAAYFFGKNAQQTLSDGGYRVFHPGVTLKAGRKPLNTIKTWFADPTKIDAATEEIKKKYAEDFGT
jgi:iron(III) transport system substrate-binding protein